VVTPPPEPVVSAPAELTGPTIRVRGARTHNLRNIDVQLPRDRLVVITGPSGSGKSSLAFDTIFAEGQRRYVESLSVAARQFLSQLPKPDVDLIEGLSPAVAIAQDAPGRNPRSTVGTVTELLDFLRLLFARVGQPFSHVTGEPMSRQSIEDMVDVAMAIPAGERFSVMAPVVVDQPGDHAARLDELARRGFVRVAVDDEVYDLSEPIALDPNRRHTIEVYVDRLKMKEGIRGRVADSIETAAALSEGIVKLLPLHGEPTTMSDRYSDLAHGLTYPELTPSLFSYNSPHGACERCDGLGQLRGFDPRKLVPDPSRSLADGAIAPWSGRGGVSRRERLAAVAAHCGVDMSTPWSDLPATAQIAILEGTGDEPVAGLGDKPFEGVRPALARRVRELQAREDPEDSEGPSALEQLEAYLSEEVCPSCEGQRLRLEARMVRVGGDDLPTLCRQPLRDLARTIDGWSFEGSAHDIAQAVLEQVRRRLAFLQQVGLGYLTLERRAMTLSGGELQRIRLANQVGAALVGVTYILDEPSIGLHPRDNDRLIETLLQLRDLGNSVIVVEHDFDTIRAADYVVDMGPGAGDLGGQVVAAGPPSVIAADPNSPTGNFLSGRARIEVPVRRRKISGRRLTVRGATGHNLRDVTVGFPLGRLTAVTGVSGSGKSSLVIDTLLPEARRLLSGAAAEGLPHKRLEGLSGLDKVIHVDQSPIGRSPRSNPATFTGIFSELRQVFAQLPAAKLRGYSASRFSFNVAGGRCETCQGEGVRRIEMHFLADLFVTCDRCAGRRYNRETLAVAMRGKTIADVLDMRVAEACDFFVSHPAIRAKLEVLRDVGLGYVTLGQSALTLSGGEAQRIKLAKELSRKSTGQTLFILDEPTTGLHASDIKQLLAVLARLVDEGNTVIVIEHDLDVIKSADYVVDLGPDGGDGGGMLVVAGTPEHVARSGKGHTARYLARALEAG
jgi:excinuclease ABC subunit A